MEEALTLSSLVIYFLNILTNFRHIVLQSARKLNSQVFQERNFANKMVSFHNLNVIFVTNLIFPLLSSMFNFFHSCSTFLVQETASKKKTGRIDLINTLLMLISKLLKIFTAPLQEKHITKINRSLPDSIQKCVDELICLMCFF